MVHNEALTADARKLFPLLSRFGGNFYLSGGTALALQIGHRVSIDFDLFSPDPIKKTLLAEAEAVFAEETVEPSVNNSRELTIFIEGVKHTFLHYPFPIVLPLEKGAPIDLLSSAEILATKAYTIGRRGALKDYVDLYAGIRGPVSSLAEVIALARRKYGTVFNDRLFLEQLLYLDDVEEDTITMLGRPAPSKAELVDFFSAEIGRLHL